MSSSSKQTKGYYFRLYLQQRFHTEDVSRWTGEQVAKFLELCGLSELAETCKSQSVDGSVFAELTQSNLRELGLRSIGEQKRLCRLIRTLGSLPADWDLVFSLVFKSRCQTNHKLAFLAHFGQQVYYMVVSRKKSFSQIRRMIGKRFKISSKLLPNLYLEYSMSSNMGSANTMFVGEEKQWQLALSQSRSIDFITVHVGTPPSTSSTSNADPYPIASPTDTTLPMGMMISANVHSPRMKPSSSEQAAAVAAAAANAAGDTTIYRGTPRQRPSLKSASVQDLMASTPIDISAQDLLLENERLRLQLESTRFDLKKVQKRNQDQLTTGSTLPYIERSSELDTMSPEQVEQLRSRYESGLRVILNYERMLWKKKIALLEQQVTNRTTKRKR
mmetsp:Transcript_1671/g.2335  ORF Transcript_1671/g.2335 Transcript_1671/m.2335 type:complete len:388 (+) Transcript_1671:88-1251(+)